MRWLVLLLPLMVASPERLWTDVAGRPTPVAIQAIDLLERSEEDGLDPADYGSAALRTAATRLRSGLHGTPTPSLFRRPRRDFSHGCIRVADPVGLAEWLLGPEGWSRERIVAAMDTAPGGTVTLAQPVRVVLFYLTAFAVPGDGTVYFADDLYGHDARLDRAWKRPR